MAWKKNKAKPTRRQKKKPKKTTEEISEGIGDLWQLRTDMRKQYIKSMYGVDVQG